MTHDIFISHASADKEIADAMTVALEDQGIQCWIAPRDIRPGDTWGGSIVRAIESSRMMVIIFSASSNASRQVLREVERAVQKDIVLLPFRIDEVPPSGDMEYFLSATHWLDALTPNLDAHLRELTRISNSILKKPTSSTAAGNNSPGARTKKAEPSISTNNATPKSAHPTSSAVSSETNTVPSSKAENTKDINKVKIEETTHAHHTTELKLEARRTPPGTKFKHSQTVKPNKAQVDSTKPKAEIVRSKAKETGEKKGSSKGFIILIGLVILATAGWFLSQQTDLLSDEKSEQPVVIDSPVIKETSELAEQSASADPATAKEESVDESAIVKPIAATEKSVDLNAPSGKSESLSQDQSKPAETKPENETEVIVAENEPEISEPAINESTVDELAEDVATGQNSAPDSQNDSAQNSSNNSQNNQSNELAATPSAPPVIPKPKPKPKIDKIPPLLALADAGDLDAIMELSERYLNGRGVDRDELESVRWLETAANNGSPLAQNKLANYYANGKIVPRNDEQALIWYLLAAEQGDINSQYSLGEIYEFGFGAEANLAEAKKWYGLAADQGHAKAGLFLKKFQQKNNAENGLSPPLEVPDATQNSADDAVSDSADDAISESADDAISDTAVEIISDSAPETIPEPAPDTISDPAPES